MLEGLEREPVVIGQSDRELVEDALTDVDFDQVTMASDTTSLGNAVSDGGNNLIIVDGAGGQIDVSSTDGQALLPNQTIQGGGSTIKVRGRNSGAVTGFTAPGATPTLMSGDSNNSTGVITLADNTHVAGLNILGDGSAGFGNDGISGLNDLSNIVIEQTNVTDTGGNGIDFGLNSNDVTISNVTVTNPDFIGIDFATGATNLVIEDFTITGGALGMTDGIELSGDSSVTIRRGSITGAGTDAGDALQVGSSGSTVTISDVVINGSVDGDGLAIGGTNNIVTMNDTTFNGFFSNDVIDIENAPNTLSGSGNVFNGTSGGEFCKATAGQIGQFTFSSPVATCP